MKPDSVLDRLGASRGQGVRVAIVDSGVDPTHPWLGGRLTASYAVGPNGEGLVEVEPEDVMGHGTAAAGQVRRFAPDAELVSVRILDHNNTSSSEALLAALRGIDALHVDLVNLSLSTQNQRLALQIGLQVDDLFGAGVVTVCALGYHATGRAYPTDFASTTGVTYAALRTAELEYRPRSLVQFAAQGRETKVSWTAGTVRKVTGSSYSCPLVTGLAARMRAIDGQLEPYEVQALLKRYALRQRAGWWSSWMDEVDADPTD